MWDTIIETGADQLRSGFYFGVPGIRRTDILVDHHLPFLPSGNPLHCLVGIHSLLEQLQVLHS